MAAGRKVGVAACPSGAAAGLGAGAGASGGGGKGVGGGGVGMGSLTCIGGGTSVSSAPGWASKTGAASKAAEAAETRQRTANGRRGRAGGVAQGRLEENWTGMDATIRPGRLTAK